EGRTSCSAWLSRASALAAGCRDRSTNGGACQRRDSRVEIPLAERRSPRQEREASMAATLRGAIRELLEQTMVTIDALLEASDGELAMPSSHGCAQGKDAWTLITNDIDHEKIHTAQVLEGRYESRITASPMERLVAEWLAERARFIGSAVGLREGQFKTENPAGPWTYRGLAKAVTAFGQ